MRVGSGELYGAVWSCGELRGGSAGPPGVIGSCGELRSGAGLAARSCRELLRVVGSCEKPWGA
eukprot:11430918-Alexandrium_andersonii.AAC.1